MQYKAKVFTGSIKLISSNTIVYLLQFAFYLTIVRVLKLEYLGIYQATALIFVLLNFAFTWPNSGFNRYITGYYQVNKQEEARGLYLIGIALGLIGGFIIIAISCFFGKYLSLIYFGNINYVLILKLMALDLLVSAYNSYAGISLNASMRFGKYGFIQVIWAVLRYGTGIMLLFMGFGPIGLIIGWIAGDLGSAAFYTYWSLDFIKGPKSKPPIKPIIIFAAPLALGGSITLLLQNFDKIFVLRYLGVAELGSYTTIMIASSVPQMIPSSLGSTLLPAFIGIEEKGWLNADVVSKSIRYITILTIPLLFFIAFLGKPLILLFLGSEFVHDWKAFAIFTAGHAIMSYDIPINQALVAKKETKTLAIQQLVSSSLLAFLAPMLIKYWFAVGAALAYVIVRFVGFIGVAFPRARSLNLLKIELNEYVKTMVIALIISFTTLYIEILFNFSIIMIPLYIAVGLILFIISANALKLLRVDDYTALMEAIPLRFKSLFSRFWSIARFPMPDPEIKKSDSKSNL